MALVHAGKFVWIVDNWALYVKRGKFWTEDILKKWYKIFEMKNMSNNSPAMLSNKEVNIPFVSRLLK